MKWVAVLIATIAVLAIPYPSEVAPPWKIQVVDKAGAPVARCKITETWQWTPLDRMPFMEQTQTDTQGWASLPRQIRWLNAARRIQAFVQGHLSFHGNAHGPVYWIIAARMPEDAVHPGVMTNAFDSRTNGVTNVEGVLTYRVVALPPDELFHPPR